MGIVLDTSVFIEKERHANTSEISFSTWADNGEAFISVITSSELLVGSPYKPMEVLKLKRLSKTMKFL
jgi:predicted nucleic acid-binding protein